MIRVLRRFGHTLAVKGSKVLWYTGHHDARRMRRLMRRAIRQSEPFTEAQ
jgi:hypothetical protein